MRRSIIIACLMLLSTTLAIAADVYVATDSGVVYLNSKNGHITAIANGPGYVNSVKATSDGTTVYGPHYGVNGFSDGVVVIDTKSKSATAFMPSSGTPRKMFLDDVNGVLYVTCQKGIDVYNIAIDPATKKRWNTMVKVIDITAIAPTGAISVALSANILAVGTGSAILRYDISVDPPVLVDQATTAQPIFLTYSPDGTKLYALLLWQTSATDYLGNAVSGNLFVYSTASGLPLLAALNLGAADEQLYGAAWAATRLYITAIADYQNLYAVDSATDTLVNTLSMSGWVQTGIDYGSDGKLYIAAFTPGGVTDPQVAFVDTVNVGATPASDTVGKVYSLPNTYIPVNDVTVLPQKGKK